MKNKDTNQNTQNNEEDTKVLGDINPVRRERSNPSSIDRQDRADDRRRNSDGDPDDEKDADERPSGVRDSEGVTGGTSVGGTRNFRTGSGASGGDLGNRPE